MILGDVVVGVHVHSVVVVTVGKGCAQADHNNGGSQNHHCDAPDDGCQAIATKTTNTSTIAAWGHRRSSARVQHVAC